MAFIDSVRNFNEKIRCEINSNEIQNRVEAAMQLQGEQRDKALKQIMFEVYSIDALAYERVRVESQLHLMENLDLSEDYLSLPSRPDFIKGYISLITERAKELDPQYEPPFMLGLDIEEVKDLQMAIMCSYTMREAAQYRLFTSRGIENSYDDIEKARFGQTRQAVRNYPDALGNSRSAIEDVHIQKEMMKAEFGKKSIFWRIRHPFKAYEMWDFIRTAEKALKDVNFTAEDGERVTVAYNNMPASSAEEIQANMNVIDEMYSNMEKQKSEHRNSVVSQEKDKQSIQVKIDEPAASTKNSPPVSQDHHIEKTGVQIN
jgi:hypothetical protein